MAMRGTNNKLGDCSSAMHDLTLKGFHSQSQDAKGNSKQNKTKKKRKKERNIETSSNLSVVMFIAMSSPSFIEDIKDVLFYAVFVKSCGFI